MQWSLKCAKSRYPIKIKKISNPLVWPTNCPGFFYLQTAVTCADNLPVGRSSQYTAQSDIHRMLMMYLFWWCSGLRFITIWSVGLSQIFLVFSASYKINLSLEIMIRSEAPCLNLLQTVFQWDPRWFFLFFGQLKLNGNWALRRYTQIAK